MATIETVCNNETDDRTCGRLLWLRFLLAVGLLLVGCLGSVGVSAAQGPVRAITSPPIYFGTVDNGADCGQRYETRGYEPSTGAGERYPLFLYFVGTNIGNDPEVDRLANMPATSAVTEAMAHRGFVALTVDYDNSVSALLSDHGNQTRCLFAGQDPRSLLGAACALTNVDCDLGIAVWGHSQGGALAHLAPNHDSRVRAVWATGYGGEMSSTLPKNRLRILAGENEDNGSPRVLDKAAGFAAGECPDDGRSECLRPDGSGWVIVRKSDVETGADHCWFFRRSCWDTEVFLEPSWIDPLSTKPYAIGPNADWIADTARRPLA